MITTKNLTKIYSAGTPVRALDALTLEVAAGSFVAITGPSGSGKSTLLNIIGTLDAPSSGQVWVDGVEVSTLRGDALADFRRARIGFVFQMFHLAPALTALENVMLPLLPYRRGLPFRLEERGAELLEMVDLHARMQHLPGQLSGGEQQRVAIARALINTPRIILADEPTGNLDSQAGAEIVALLRQLNLQRGVTILISTHNEALARAADRTIRLRDGRLV
ncbi:MAG: Lipoprotein-releasing system ATP-binding protein LolD [Chloroflexi bacterium ADurb.Bin222]|nr:MAG: Lipoprotein-releasing system ATP-binding protein LolD [Chloroflexi bacterium ADurb.Bin222]